MHKAYQMPEHSPAVCNTQTQYHGVNCFIFSHEDHELNSRNTEFTNLQEESFGYFRPLSDDITEKK